MTAIQPEQLKKQAAELALDLNAPDRFMRRLDELLNLYADRATRPGQSGEPSPLLERYGVPTPVFRYLLLALAPHAQGDPEAALILCDRLWQKPILEYRTLAVGLLGRLPLAEATAVLTRATTWAQGESDRRLVLSIFQQGLEIVRQGEPERILRLAQDWLASGKVVDQRRSLQLLLTLAGDPAYENIPAFFDLLTPWVCRMKTELRPDLLDLVRVLARRSAPEAAYFIQQLLEISNCQTGAWLARQVLPHLPEQVALVLRRALHAISNQPTRPISRS